MCLPKENKQNMIVREKAEGTLRGEYTFLTYICFKLTTKTPRTNQERKKEKICFLFISCNYVDSI